MVAALRCVQPQFQWYQLAYATEIKSIQLHDSIEGLSQKIVSSTLHYISGCMHDSKRIGIETVVKNNGDWIIKKLQYMGGV